MAVIRKAVLVGIDQYQIPGANLEGCKNDALDIYNSLRVLGFPRTRMHMLTDARATKANIVKELTWLTKDMKPGDVAIYFQSSHGTQLPDMDDDESDGVDEVAVTHDFDWDNPDTQLTDDDFYNYFTTKLDPGVRTDVLFDTCFSGTMTKSFRRFGHSNMTLNSRYLTPPPEFRERVYAIRPENIQWNYLGKSVVEPIKKEIGEVAPKLAEKMQNNVLWSACQYFQESWELGFNGEIRGAFTYFFTKRLRAANGNITRNNLFDNVRRDMSEAGFPQIPDLALPDKNPDAGRMVQFRRASEKDTEEEINKIVVKK